METGRGLWRGRGRRRRGRSARRAESETFAVALRVERVVVVVLFTGATIKDVALFIGDVVRPVGAVRLGVDARERVVGALVFAHRFGALLRWSVVHAYLFVSGEILIAATLVATAGCLVLSARRIDENVRAVIIVVLLIFTSFEKVALFLSDVIRIRRTRKVRVLLALGFAFGEGTISRAWSFLRADFVVRRDILVTSSLLAAERVVFDGSLARFVLHGVRGVVQIKLGVGTARKDVALFFSYIVRPVRARLANVGTGERTAVTLLHALSFRAVGDAWSDVGADFRVRGQVLVASRPRTSAFSLRPFAVRF